MSMSPPSPQPTLQQLSGSEDDRVLTRDPSAAVIWVVAAVIVLILAMAGWFIWALSHAFDPPDNHVAAQDSRVCAGTQGNDISLADATNHFELALPKNATHLTFAASAGGMQGEYDLSLRFTTTSAGLASFLAGSHLANPTAATQVTDGNWPSYPVTTKPQGPCGLTPPNAAHMVYSQDSPDSPMGGSPRSVAVDLTDPARPQVWVDAMDL